MKEVNEAHEPTAEETAPVVERLLEVIQGEDLNVGISAVLTLLVWLLTDHLSTRAEIFDAVNKVRDLFTPMAVIRTWQAKKADGLIN